MSAALETLGNPSCLFGWKSPDACNYTGGCGCWMPFAHDGYCKCDMCGSRKKRPTDWDARGRAEANA